MLTQLPLPPALLECFALPQPEPVAVHAPAAKSSSRFKKPRMQVHVVTWTCPDTGRFWKRHFPQTKSMKDWKGERNLFRCLKNLDVMGTTYHIQTIDRTAFNWR